MFYGITATAGLFAMRFYIKNHINYISKISLLKGGKKVLVKRGMILFTKEKEYEIKRIKKGDIM